MKKMISLLAAFVLMATMFAGCSTDSTGSSTQASSAATTAAATTAAATTAPAKTTAAATTAATTAPAKTTAAATTAAASTFDTSKEITVISREDGSGTRGAFIELMKIEEKDASGNKVDHTTEEALIANKTDVMLMQVAGNAYGIGYVSLGSLNDTVKALTVDGVEATVENIKAGTYKVSRPFNIATKGAPEGVAKDFIDFIMSKDGQAIITAEKYIQINDSAAAFTSAKPTGKIVIAGSSSVTPVMEKLVEAYLKINTGAEIEVQQSDSTAGMTGAIDGTCDIGMASRELKDAEKAELTATVIAMDGIAVIVNNENTLDNITSENVKLIYTGEITKWSDVK